MKRKRSFDEDSFGKFLKENFSRLEESWQEGDSIWGTCCTSVGFSNQPKNRKLLYTRWKNNYSGIKSQIMKEQDAIMATDTDNNESLAEDKAATSNLKSDIEMMMLPSYAMLKCSNCSVYFIFSSITYDQCPLIDYLCSHCSLSSTEYEKRTKTSNLTSISSDNIATISNSPIRSKTQKTGVADHGYCEETKKSMIANVDNFVNEVTIETSNSPLKANFPGFPSNKVPTDAKNLKNESVIYISNTEKLKKFSSEISSDILDSDQVESNRYQFILSSSDWNQISPYIGKEFSLICCRLFMKYFSQFGLGCNLSFRHCHRYLDSCWKSGDKFIKVVGICKQDYCCEYIFTVDTPPKADESIVVNISQIGVICHLNKLGHASNSMKSTNSIVSVEEQPKYTSSEQYKNDRISVQEGNPSTSAPYNPAYFVETQIEERSMEKSSNEENSSVSSDDDDDDDEAIEFQDSDPIERPPFDYSSHNQFTLDYKDWEKMMPSFDEHKLKNGWQIIFAEYFHQFDLGCILDFTYCRLRKPFSMDSSVYLSTYAKCRYPNCSTFLFRITHKPIKGEIVIVDVFQQGCVSHKTDDVEGVTDNSSLIKNVATINSEPQEMYYTVDNLPDNLKEPDLDVSQVVTVVTSLEESRDIKSELVSSGTDSEAGSSFNIENQILPFELNSEGKILESVIHKFEINYADWLKMKPLKHCKTLQPGWTDIFFSYFANLNLGCILTFSYCYANKRSVSKKGTNYLRIKSICKFTGCCKYYFNMKREPKPGKNGKVNAIQVGTISHREGEVRARFIRGKYRKEVAKQLEHTSAFDYYNQNRDRLAESGYESTRKKSLHVLRNIKIKKKDAQPSSSHELESSGSFNNFVNKMEDGCIRLL